MGEVWEARHLELEAPVAIKFAIERRLRDKSYVARFRREACALAHLRSPNIVQVFDIGVHEGFPFIVMELLLGETLRARLERDTRLTIREASAVVEPIARALAVIHRAGMVHRDVTPANVFLLESICGEERPDVKLLDFGIVKEIAADTRVTVSGTVVGSPAYMSPEQARAESVDKRSDLWSLGALTFRAITGNDPFTGSCVTDVLFSICTGDIPRVGSRFAGVEGNLDAFFARALARNPHHRYQDANSMANELCQIADLAMEAEHEPRCTRSRVVSGNSLGRTATTAELSPASVRLAGQTPPRVARRQLQLTMALCAVLGAGAFGGYFYGRTARVSSRIPGSESQANARAPATPLAPASGMPPQAPSTSSAAIVTSPLGTDAGRLPVVPRHSTKPALEPNHTNHHPVDPIFGLPVDP